MHDTTLLFRLHLDEDRKVPSNINNPYANQMKTQSELEKEQRRNKKPDSSIIMFAHVAGILILLNEKKMNFSFTIQN